MSRTYPTHTPLGAWMKELGLKVKTVEYLSEISYRTLSDYLAGREEIRTHHLPVLLDVLEVEYEEFVDGPNGEFIP